MQTKLILRRPWRGCQSLSQHNPQAQRTSVEHMANCSGNVQGSSAGYMCRRQTVKCNMYLNIKFGSGKIRRMSRVWQVAEFVSNTSSFLTPRTRAEYFNIRVDIFALSQLYTHAFTSLYVTACPSPDSPPTASNKPRPPYPPQSA